MEIEREVTHVDPVTGSQETVHTEQHVPSTAAVKEHKANQAGAIIAYIVGVIDVLLLIRIVFLLFGAKDTGFADLIYSITAPFVAIFKGIFGSPASDTGYFDTAALLAIIVYGLVGWGITALIDIGKPKAV